MHLLNSSAHLLNSSAHLLNSSAHSSRALKDDCLMLSARDCLFDFFIGNYLTFHIFRAAYIGHSAFVHAVQHYVLMC